MTLTTTTARNPLAPITLEDALMLKMSPQPVVNQQPLLTEDQQSDAAYEDYLNDRLARYGY